MKRNFSSLFPEKPIIGMIHLAGEDRDEKVKRAIEEMIIYQEEGINGVIIEDYHGSPADVYETMLESSKKNLRIIRGVNILRNPYSAFKFASDFGAKFIQFDSVQTLDLDLEKYNSLRKKYSGILVFGGIGFKYTKPTGNPLEIDLEEGKSRCEAVVTTGEGTGIETSIEKLKKFKELLGNFPLIVGAGINSGNIYEQMQICNGAIVGSYFKNGNTNWLVCRDKVKTLVNALQIK